MPSPNHRDRVRAAASAGVGALRTRFPRLDAAAWRLALALRAWRAGRALFEALAQGALDYADLEQAGEICTTILRAAEAAEARGQRKPLAVERGVGALERLAFEWRALARRQGLHAVEDTFTPITPDELDVLMERAKGRRPTRSDSNDDEPPAAS